MKERRKVEKRNVDKYVKSYILCYVYLPKQVIRVTTVAPAL